jgi:phage tail P2-like protein
MTNDLLPPSATKQERDMALATARVSNVPSPLRSLWDPNTCPLELLPWLAWALSVDTWNPEWPELTKRAVVRMAITTARVKGTKKSVVDALNAIGSGAVMTEWFERSPAGTPHTFRVTIVAQDTSLEAQALMTSEINRTKPLRSHYDIVFGASGESSLNIVGVLRPAVFVRLDGGSIY